MDIGSPLESIPRISPVYRRRLQKLGIKNLRDLFYHFPFRYDDFSNIKNIGDLKLNETATIQGKIIDIKNARTWKKRIYVTEIHVRDDTGIIKAVWFNQPFLFDTLKQNDIISLSGKISFDKELYLSNPAYERISQIANEKSLDSNSGTTNHERSSMSGLRHTGGLIPVYPETTGLSSRWLRYIIKMLLPKYLPQIKDHLPLEIKRAQGLIDLARAIEQIHFPKTKKHTEQARHRLAFDELFFIQLFTLQQKAKWQEQSAPIIYFDETLIKDFVRSLPFSLTDAQRKSAWEILQDLQKPKPMNRLLEGDVGSGKTVVAVMAMLQAVKKDWQVALMAPTEILAQQHFKTITNLLAGQDIAIGLLTGSQSVIASPAPSRTKQSRPITAADDNASGSPRSFSLGVVARNDMLKKTSSGQIKILIGTHALIQEKVKFKNLALVAIDEQHRFGVAQRAALQKNISAAEDGSTKTVPHLLTMTATPIPRTLALAAYGDLDISLLDEMPENRQEIITKIVSQAQRQQTYEFIKQQIKKGRQVFVICPRIEASAPGVNANDPAAAGELGNPVENNDGNNDSGLLRPPRGLPRNDKRAWDDVKTVKEEYEKLSKLIFPDLKIAMLHGKIKPKEKERIMSDFKTRQADILVSTSVVEVGIDIPNATVMMIEGAERFGLAQLHQFRGRVGRGRHQSYCFLITTSGSDNARLRALVRCKNGFELAEKDLALRGPGQFYGANQWGLPDLSMASLSDVTLIKNIRQEAQKLIQKDKELKNYPQLKEKLRQFQSIIHLE
jgi:ATP-dependent DNA helicase RecG